MRYAVNGMQGNSRFAVLATLFSVTLSTGFAAQIRALLIDAPPASQGHSPTVKNIFEAARLFQVDLLAASEPGEAALEKYKVVILNYGGDTLPMSTLTALQRYVSDGGGMVALAAADSAFSGQPEYRLMLGVRAATGPDASADPVWFYKDGNVAYDNAAGAVTTQIASPNGPVLVTIRNTEHPVTKGVPLQWMHLPDEIAGNLRGPGKNMTLLATVFSDSAKGGTGRNEPAMIAVNYGKGRVFHTLLGRTSEALQCAGLQTMLQRGAEWAATGKVTQRIPADFPDEEKISRRLK
jgi:type 1 glutamine amidotransferase